MHRSGRAGDDHKDPQASPVLLGRTTHTLSPSAHPASPAALALGGLVHRSPGATACPAASCLTTAPVSQRHPHPPIEGLLALVAPRGVFSPASGPSMSDSTPLSADALSGPPAVYLPEIPADGRARNPSSPIPTPTLHLSVDSGLEVLLRSSLPLS